MTRGELISKSYEDEGLYSNDSQDRIMLRIGFECAFNSQLNKDLQELAVIEGKIEIVQILNELVKTFEVRIKEVQKESKDAYSQEDVWIANAIETELIGWKIHFEKKRKSLKYLLTETINQ